MAAAHIADPRPVAPCPGCRKTLPEDAPKGLCPTCLINLVQHVFYPDDSDDLSESDTPDGHETPLPPSRRTCVNESNLPSPETITLGRYVGLEPHIKGGIGEVFTANDTELHRVVALKRLQDKCANDPASQRRFLLEAEVTARLEHPGVVPVHSLFRDDSDRPCYSMRFIQGRTLADAIKSYHASPADSVAFRRLLQSFIQVCETIAYAHSRGVIHRDLKPQNIMLGQFGETLVVDWGLAKVVGRGEDERSTHPEATLRPVGDGSGDETEMGSAVGTPAYMSPEQAAGRWDVIHAASDVYSLGAVLYTVLTGRPPLEKGERGNWPEMQQKIQRGEFPRPRSVKPTTPKALEAVCMKAMAMKPEDRYPSARDLKADVEQWLADEPVGAYPEPVIARMGRWARRRKERVLAGGSLLFACLVLIVGGQIYFLERANRKTKDMMLSLEQAGGNPRTINALMNEHYTLIQNIEKTLDSLAAYVSHDSRLQGPPFQPVRQDFFQRTVQFWDRSIENAKVKGDLAWRVPHHAIQRSLCLARAGEHDRAADGIRDLWSNSNALGPSLQELFDLARVYSLCAAASPEDEARVKKYSDSAMASLKKLTEARWFHDAAKSERLKTDPDLSALRQRQDFADLLRQVGLGLN